MSPEEAKQRLALLEAKQKEVVAILEQVVNEDPFWGYEPTVGELSEEGKKVLEKWVREEDRPDKFLGTRDVFKSNAEIVVMSGGNQAGKTITEVIDSIIQCTGDLPASLQEIYPIEKLPTKFPVYGRVYGKTAAFIEEVLIPKFRTWMPKKYWHREGWERTYNKQAKMLTFYDEGRKVKAQIKFLSYDQDVGSTQGVSLKFGKFDEVPPKEFYDELKPRFTTASRVDISFYCTPTEGIGWIEQVLLPRTEEADDTVAAFEISTLTNPYANLKNVNEAMKDLPYNEVLVRLLGQHKSLSGLIYKGAHRVIPAIHVVQPFELDWNKYIVYRGLDPHPSKETCCVEMAVDVLGNKYVIGSYFEDADSDVVKQALAKRVADGKYRLGWTSYDPSLDYEAQGYNGINIVQKFKQPPNALPAMFAAQKYKGSIDAGIDVIKQDLKLGERSGKPRLYFFDTPEVWRVVKDIMTLERDQGKNEDKRGKRDKLNEGTKDFHQCLRYIYQRNPQYIPPEDVSTESYVEERYI